MSGSIERPYPCYQQEKHQVELTLAHLLPERTANQQERYKWEYGPRIRPEPQLGRENPKAEAERAQRNNIPCQNRIGVVKSREGNGEQDRRGRMGVDIDINTRTLGRVPEVTLNCLTMTEVNGKPVEQIAGGGPVLEEIDPERPGRPQAVDEVRALQTADENCEPRP